MLSRPAKRSSRWWRPYAPASRLPQRSSDERRRMMVNRDRGRLDLAMLDHTQDVLVIGAGQAGLALGAHLKTTPFRFQLVDRHGRIGDSWRKRYDSLVLFTPRTYSALPGLAVPGDPNGFPTKDEMADYL